MRILVLSFYFQPDLCAGSFRAAALVKTLSMKLSPGSYVDVVTTLPNRYSTFDAAAPEFENYQGISIRRIKIPSHASGMIDQSKAFLHFAKEAKKIAFSNKYDLVFATSSRLMTAALGAFVAGRQGAKLYLDIRDIFVDTIKDVLPRRSAILVKPVFALVERMAFARADRINLVSRGFASYFKERYPKTPLSYFTNGIDEEFVLSEMANNKMLPTSRPLSIVYAGNIGEGQGLHEIIPLLAMSMREKVQFKVIGDGGRRNALEQAINFYKVENVELLPPVNREELVRAYENADVLFLHLNDYDAFKKVLPSKIFEYAAMGKPIWAGVSGYAAEFIRSEIDNASVFDPCDVNGAKRAFAELCIGDKLREEFIEKYTRANIMNAMAEEILFTAQEGV